jgi:hypothetical protein
MTKKQVVKAMAKRNWLSQHEYAEAERHGVDVSSYHYDGYKGVYVR